MMREAQRRGHQALQHANHATWSGSVAACSPGRRCGDITLTGDVQHWLQKLLHVLAPALAQLHRRGDAQGPAVDSEYFYATHIVGTGRARGARVCQQAACLRDHPESSGHPGISRVHRSNPGDPRPEAIRAFHAQHHDIILSRWTAWAAWVSSRQDDGLNLGSIMETLNQDGAQTVMVQKFLPAIAGATSGCW